MRQIVLDTETTGLSPESGHRIIEIGCLELIDRRITENHFHHYINPLREIDQGAIAVHGISNEFLQDKPTFDEIVDEFIAYIKGAELIIHNARFDVKFMDKEFFHTKKSIKTHDICTVFDTLPFARKKHPGQKNNLDALCKRYEVDISDRSYHGALLDAKLLANVFLAMTGSQATLFDEGDANTLNQNAQQNRVSLKRNKPLKIIRASQEDILAQEKLMGE